MTDANEKGRIQRDSTEGATLLGAKGALEPWFPLTITPISKNPKSASNIDYNEQVARVGHRWCWDDSRYNTANVGEYFAYYFHGIKVVVHKILEVKSPTERLPSWSRNVGQGNRNVLELSDPLCVIPWSTWQEMKGPENKMGTYRTELSNKRPLLLEYFRRNIFITG